MEIKKIDFQRHGDGRGMLVVAEYQKEIPFEVKRVYYIYGADGETRRRSEERRVGKECL